MIAKDFDILLEPGNVGFFKSCEITQLFVIRKSDNRILNLFILACLEEKAFVSRNHQFLASKPIAITDEWHLGIQRYWLSIHEVKTAYTKLVGESKWDFDGDEALLLGKLTHLPKQYIPAKEGNRLNYILKNNFHSGSHIIEFFDESKEHLAFLLDIAKVKLLNEVNDAVSKIVPLDLSVARDRIGNIIFQFPNTILETSSKCLKTWDGVNVRFVWHHEITLRPECLIQVEAIFERNYMGAAISEYDKTDSQILQVGSLDQIASIKIWRKNPNLLLSTFEGTYIREFQLTTGIISPQPRIFEIGDEIQNVEITGIEVKSGKEERRYTTYVNSTLYSIEQRELENSLSFKQYYIGDEDKALQDLRKLIAKNGKHGVYLWDPFLRANDIFKTLYFSPRFAAPLKAIGSTNSSTKRVYNTRGANSTQIIADEKLLFENPNNNNYGLNLEFRMQHTNHGWPFHDRFLIFPGTETDRPRVYSLGTSVNSIGQSHHILHEVSHPQRVVDAFDDLWQLLNDNECLVWKFPTI